MIQHVCQVVELAVTLTHNASCLKFNKQNLEYFMDKTIRPQEKHLTQIKHPPESHKNTQAIRKTQNQINTIFALY